ncbi:MAG: 30S ribosomal protein S6, partial [Planctomycetota bacterium]
MSDEYRTHNYEAMFLFPQSAGPRLAECVDHVVEIITKNGAELLGLKKWDERRLAYEIDKQKRGLYLLGYFRVDASAMKGIDRDLRLS